MKIKILFAALLLAATLRLPAATNDFTAQLQQGLMDEEASHDLNAAIADYQALATRFDQDRQMAATAIYRLGECYRKLGRTNDAVAAYQRIIRDFGDQPELVTLSRQNLTGLGTEPESHFVTRLQAVINPESSASTDTPADEEAGEIQRIQTMMQNSPDLINAPGGDGPPLIKAAFHGWLKVAAFLLDHGADVNAQNSPRAGQMTALNAAASAGNRAMVEFLLSRGANANSKNGMEGGTALQTAIEANFPTVTEALLAGKANVNAQDNAGATPLQLAAEHDQVRITQMLLAAGANPNLKNNNDGQTPVILAALYNSLETMKLLLAAGANPNLENNQGWQALSDAIERGTPAMVAVLLAAKADPNGGRVDAPLFCAIHRQDIVSAGLLLQAGANPNTPGIVDANAGNGDNTKPVTPLHRAISTDQPAMVQLLLKYKAGPNDAQTDQPPLIFQALADTNILESLLAAGATVDARDATAQILNGRSLNWTPLIFAVERNLPAGVVQILLQHGANPNLRDDSRGETPLHWMEDGLGNGRLPQRAVVELLLDHQADPNLRDWNGETPLGNLKNALHQASPDNRVVINQLADLLRQHGALDYLPDWDRITVSRPSANFSQPVFTKTTNDWNQFTLLEMLAVQCRFLASSAIDNGVNMQFDGSTFFLNDQPLPFPDLARLRIRRPTPDRKGTTEQTVDLAAGLESGDCSHDVPLQWGDLVEIPETDHSLNDRWEGFSLLELTNLDKCLTRQVEIIVKGQTNTVTLALGIDFGGNWRFGPQPGFPGRPGLVETKYPKDMWKVSFWLSPVLLQSKLVLASSDLAHVKVTRHDPKSGKDRVWVVDCSGIIEAHYNNPDLWLRDGDVIEVPEKP